MAAKQCISKFCKIDEKEQMEVSYLLGLRQEKSPGRVSHLTCLEEKALRYASNKEEVKVKDRGFFEVVKERRSIRKFKDEPIPESYLEKILEAARWAMSGANSQPWQFIVIKNREVKDRLASIYSRYREITLALELTRLEEYRQPAFRAPDSTQSIEAIRSRFTAWSKAPVIIALVGDPRLLQASTLAARLYEIHTFDQSLAICAYTIHLAASALGLGAQWISLLPPIAEAMKEELAVPRELVLFNLNAIGYPDYEPVPYRRELSSLLHYDRYDMANFMNMEDVQKYILHQRKMHASGGAYRVGSKD